MKKVIFTYLTGGYGELVQPTVVTPDWRYVCFTDRVESERCGAWEIHPILGGSKTNVQKARSVKLTPHGYIQADLWVSCDIMITPRCNLDDFVSHYLRGEMTLMAHPSRDCIYEEGEACKRLNKDSPELIDAYLNKLRLAGYPEHQGMVATGLMIRRNTQTVRDFGEKWLQELLSGSHRDQLSFNYIDWKLRKEGVKLDYSMMPFDVLVNEFLLRKGLPKTIPITR